MQNSPLVGLDKIVHLSHIFNMLNDDTSDKHRSYDKFCKQVNNFCAHFGHSIIKRILGYFRIFVFLVANVRFSAQSTVKSY